MKRLHLLTTAALLAGMLAALPLHAQEPPAGRAYETRLNKALAAYYRHNYEQAASLLETLLEANPDDVAATHYMGLVLYKFGRYDEAIGFLERARRLDPSLPAIELDIGLARLKQGHYEEALEALRHAQKKLPASGFVAFNIGYTLFLLDRYEEALVELRRARRLDADFSVPSLFYEGLSLYHLGRYPSALATLRDVRRRGAGTPFGISAASYIATLELLTKPYYGALSTGYQFDTNVVLEPDAIEITDEQDSRWFANFTVAWRPVLKDDYELKASWNTYFSLHADIEQLNLQAHRFDITSTKRTTLGRYPAAFTFNYFYNFVLVDGSPADELFSQTHAVSQSLSVAWAKHISTEVAAELRFDNFKEFPERDAVRATFTVAESILLRRGLTLLRPGVTASFNFADDIAGRRNFDQALGGVFIETTSYMPWELTLFARLHYYAASYYNDPFDRVDNQLGLKVVVSRRLYRTVSLDLGWENVSNFSSSDFPGPEPFEYFRNIFSATLSARF